MFRCSPKGKQQRGFKMVELKISENFCLNILYILDKNVKSHFAINQSMINNLNNKQGFGAGFRPFCISFYCPKPLFVVYQQGANT